MTDTSAIRDEQVNLAIADYLAAAERGTPLDPDEWLRRYPSFAGELATFLADHERAMALLAPLGEPVTHGSQVTQDEGVIRGERGAVPRVPVLYELLTGRPPFESDSTLETLLKVRCDEPTRPRVLIGAIDRDLETVCLKCMEKDPQRRYTSAEATAEELERWLGGEAIYARPVGSGERLWRWCKRNPRRAAMIGLVVVLLAVILVGGALLNGLMRLNRC